MNHADRFELHDDEEDFDVVLSNPDRTAADAGSARDGHSAAALMAKADAPERRETSNQYGTFKNHAASEKQMAFVKRLLDERPTLRDAAYDAEKVANMDKRQISRLIDDLMKVPAEVVDPTRLASEKQVALIAKLIAERDATGIQHADHDPSTLGKAQASALIDALFAAPKSKVVKSTGRKVIDEDGFYVLRHDDAEPTIYKVQIAKHGSGNLYAKRLVMDTSDGGKGEWVYEGRKPLHLPLEKLTLELAKELGHLYGICCCCGASLTRESSIEAGIGPVCASRL